MFGFFNLGPLTLLKNGARSCKQNPCDFFMNESEVAMEKQSEDERFETLPNLQSENDDCVGIRWNFVRIKQVDRMKCTIAN